MSKPFSVVEVDLYAAKVQSVVTFDTKGQADQHFGQLLRESMAEEFEGAELEAKVAFFLVDGRYLSSDYMVQLVQNSD